MTVAEMVQCLISEAEDCVRYEHGLPSKYLAAIEARDAIKATMVTVIEDYEQLVRVSDYGTAADWSSKYRKLEEACRGH